MLTSHRGVRLHTFQPEDRAYTSTPTKIGGHSLDHVRSGLDLRSRSTAAAKGGKSPAALGPAGRFGGLGDVVLKLGPHVAPPTTNSPIIRTPTFPLYQRLVDFPQDTIWEQEYIPRLRDVRREVGAFHDRIISPQFHAQHEVVNQSCNTVTVRHMGALVAVLLSKLVEGDESRARSPSNSVDFDYGAAGASQQASDNATHHMVDVSEETASRGSSVAGRSEVAACSSLERSELSGWHALLQQAPSYSKLRRYNFIRQVGGGSHGKILLVKKKTSGSLRVLKESYFLAEAVNEARLLMLVNSLPDNGEVNSDRERMPAEEHGRDRLEHGTGGKHDVRVDLIQTTARASNGFGGRHKRGRVLQVRQRVQQSSLCYKKSPLLK